MINRSLYIIIFALKNIFIGICYLQCCSYCKHKF